MQVLAPFIFNLSDLGLELLGSFATGFFLADALREGFDVLLTRINVASALKDFRF